MPWGLSALRGTQLGKGIEVRDKCLSLDTSSKQAVSLDPLAVPVKSVVWFTLCYNQFQDSIQFQDIIQFQDVLPGSTMGSEVDHISWSGLGPSACC